MREFFGGWKRKLGVVTLLMACAFAAGWIQSLFVMSEFLIPTGTRISIGGISTDQYIGYGTILFPESQQAPLIPVWQPRPYKKFEQIGVDDKMRRITFWRWIVVVHSADVTLYIIPYWSIVIPLTLLSAWLLLSKPGMLKSPLATEGQPE